MRDEGEGVDITGTAFRRDPQRPLSGRHTPELPGVDVDPVRKIKTALLSKELDQRPVKQPLRDLQPTASRGPESVDRHPRRRRVVASPDELVCLTEEANDRVAVVLSDVSSNHDPTICLADVGRGPQ